MKIRFIDLDGAEHLVEAEEGESVMRCAARHVVSGIVGECGGSLACATCHGYVEGETAAILPPPSELEVELLEGCIDVQPNSRLTCQLILNPALDGMTIRVPRSQT